MRKVIEHAAGSSIPCFGNTSCFYLSTSYLFSSSPVHTGNSSVILPSRLQKYQRGLRRHCNRVELGSILLAEYLYRQLIKPTRYFFISYVILQGLGIMPLQLLNLGVVIPRIFMLMFFTRTPRGLIVSLSSASIIKLLVDFAELNAPPMINYGVVYPQAILIFVVTILYSVIQPIILIFGALYFGIGYLVYKYKLLFGECRPES